MSGADGQDEGPFVVAPRDGSLAGGDSGAVSDIPMAGGTRLDPSIARAMRARHVANPDDPRVQRTAPGAGGPPVGPDEAGPPGRIAIVQGQIYIVGVIVVAQLFLVTTALYELLSGRPETLWGIAGASFLGFVVALVVTLWPRRRAKGR
jgi:hypothetical protein